MSEDRLQSDIFKWFWNTFPEYRKCLFHVPNGGNRNLREAAKFKAMGVIAGVPDLILIRKGGSLVGFEIKTETGRLSEQQKAIHIKWAEHNVLLHVVRSLEQFQQLVWVIVDEDESDK